MIRKYYSVSKTTIETEIMFCWLDTDKRFNSSMQDATMGITFEDLGDDIPTPFISIAPDCFQYFFNEVGLIDDLRSFKGNFTINQLIEILEKHGFYDFSKYCFCNVSITNEHHKGKCIKCKRKVIFNRKSISEVIPVS